MVTELAAIFDRLGRAEEHLEVIKCSLLRHYEADEYFMTGEYRPNFDRPGGILVTDPTTTPEIDPRVNTLIGEHLHDLRSALDHLAWQLVLTARGTSTEDTKFPILEIAPPTNEQGQGGRPGVAGGVSSKAKTLIGSAQPYKWGARYREHTLWLLHKLWNIDKHRHVIAQGSFGRYIFPAQPPTFRFTSKRDSTTPYGAKLLLGPGRSKRRRECTRHRRGSHPRAQPRDRTAAPRDPGEGDRGRPRDRRCRRGDLLLARRPSALPGWGTMGRMAGCLLNWRALPPAWTQAMRGFADPS